MSGPNDDKRAGYAHIREYEEYVAEIGASNSSDAYIHRVMLALARGEDPNPDDLNRLKQSRRDNQFGDILTSPSPGTGSPLSPEQLASLAGEVLRQVYERDSGQ